MKFLNVSFHILLPHTFHCWKIFGMVANTYPGYSHIIGALTGFFRNTEDEGFLKSVKKVKNEFPAKWRNEDQKCLQIFHMWRLKNEDQLKVWRLSVKIVLCKDHKINYGWLDPHYWHNIMKQKKTSYIFSKLNRKPQKYLRWYTESYTMFVKNYRTYWAACKIRASCVNTFPSIQS